MFQRIVFAFTGAPHLVQRNRARSWSNEKSRLRSIASAAMSLQAVLRLDRIGGIQGGVETACGAGLSQSLNGRRRRDAVRLLIVSRSSRSCQFSSPTRNDQNALGDWAWLARVAVRAIAIGHELPRHMTGRLQWASHTCRAQMLAGEGLSSGQSGTIPALLPGGALPARSCWPEPGRRVGYPGRDRSALELAC
jgi:hypothetical protein